MPVDVSAAGSLPLWVAKFFRTVPPSRCRTSRRSLHHRARARHARDRRPGAQRARLDPAHQLKAWYATASVRYDAELWNELKSLRVLATHAHVAIVGPVGVREDAVAATAGGGRCDRMLEALRHVRLDATYGASPPSPTPSAPRRPPIESSYYLVVDGES